MQNWSIVGKRIHMVGQLVGWSFGCSLGRRVLFLILVTNAEIKLNVDGCET